ENNVQVPTSTWNVMRSSFDKILFDAALAQGALWRPATALAPILESDAVIGLKVRNPDGTTENLYSEVLIDASGCATFLANHRVTGLTSRARFSPSSRTRFGTTGVNLTSSPETPCSITRQSTIGHGSFP